MSHKRFKAPRRLRVCAPGLLSPQPTRQLGHGAERRWSCQAPLMRPRGSPPAADQHARRGDEQAQKGDAAEGGEAGAERPGRGLRTPDGSRRGREDDGRRCRDERAVRRHELAAAPVARREVARAAGRPRVACVTPAACKQRPRRPAAR
jgi:hypothetical protein